MTDSVSLQEALLELGLEDLIPLSEIQATPEVRDLGQDYQHLRKISAALVDLLRTGRIQVWAGHWPDEPSLVSGDEAEALVGDERRYSFDGEADGLERVYFTNVENLRA
jgi:hypothetical protein